MSSVQTGRCPSCCPTSSVKALKGIIILTSIQLTAYTALMKLSVKEIFIVFFSLFVQCHSRLRREMRPFNITCDEDCNVVFGEVLLAKTVPKNCWVLTSFLWHLSLLLLLFIVIVSRVVDILIVKWWTACWAAVVLCWCRVSVCVCAFADCSLFWRTSLCLDCWTWVTSAIARILDDIVILSLSLF